MAGQSRWRSAGVAAIAWCCSVQRPAQAESPVEVTVRAPAARRAHAAREPSVASSVLFAEELAGAGQSTASVLARVPGVQIARTGAQSDVATASIRGADARQVPVYLGGVRLNDEVSGTADLSTVPLWMLDRVEVFRGNVPAAADRVGIGGAIFFWPKLPHASGAGAGAGVGSFGEREGYAWAALGSPRAAGSIAVRRAAADNDYSFVNDRGQRFAPDERRERRVNADYSQTDVWALGRYELGGGRLHAVLSWVEREQGLTGLSVVPARAARGITRRLLLGSSVLLPCDGAGDCWLELDSSGIVAGSRADDPLLELGPVLSPFVDNQGERAEQRARLALGLGASLQLGVGARVAAENLRVRRAGGDARGGSRRSVVPAVDLGWQLGPRLSLHGLGALECHATRGDSARFGAAVHSDGGACRLLPAGRVGARYQLGAGLELLSNVSRAVRVATLSELYGTSALVDGNPSLRPERSAAIDAGVRWAAGFGGAEVALDAFAFARRSSDLVRYRRSSLEALSPFNVAEARLLGVELALAVSALGHVRLELSGTLLDPRETTRDPVLDPTPNDILPNSARLVASSLIELHHEPAPGPLGLGRVSAGLRHQYKSSRFEDPAGQNVLPSQSLFDAELGLALGAGRAQLRAAARNLLDAQTSDLIGLPVPGRSFHASLELSL